MRLRSIRTTMLSAMLVLSVATSVPSLAADSKVPTMKSKELKTLIATAKMAKDHQKLAQYFNQQAEQYESQAKDHEEMELAYRKNPMTKNSGGSGPISHCEVLIKSSRDMAKTAREMAAAHEEMAKEAGK